MADKIREGKVRCSFCNKSEDQVRKLIAGPEGVFICDECIGICAEIMEEELAQYGPEDDFDTDINLLKPEEIHKILDDYVIGQEDAKKLCLWQFIIIIKELPQQEIWMWSFRKAIF